MGLSAFTVCASAAQRASEWISAVSGAGPRFFTGEKGLRENNGSTSSTGRPAAIMPSTWSRSSARPKCSFLALNHLPSNNASATSSAAPGVVTPYSLACLRARPRAASTRAAAARLTAWASAGMTSPTQYFASIATDFEANSRWR